MRDYLNPSIQALNPRPQDQGQDHAGPPNLRSYTTVMVQRCTLQLPISMILFAFRQKYHDFIFGTLLKKIILNYSYILTTHFLILSYFWDTLKKHHSDIRVTLSFSKLFSEQF